MRRLGFAAILCTLANVPCLAADLVQPAPPVASVYTPVVAYNWSGFYVGINGGYSFGDTSWSDQLGIATGDFSVDGPLAGGTIGINYAATPFVFGFEADADWTGLKGNSGNFYCSTNTAGALCETKEVWLATLRARAGYAANNFLLYLTAGGATGNIKMGFNPPGTFDSVTNFGWTAGGGIEAAITENWTAKIEYLYVDLGNGQCGSTTNCGLGAPLIVPLTENLVRIGINYKFGF